MENSTLVKNRPPMLKYLFIGTLIAFASCLFPLGLMIAPAFFAYAAYRTRPVSMLFFAAVFIIAANLFYGGDLGLTLFALVIAFMVLLYLLHRMRLRTSGILMALSGAGVLILYAALCLPGILSGAGAFSDIQTFMDQMIVASRETVASLAEGVPTGANILENYDTFAAAFSESVASFVVPVIASLAMTMALANLVFFRMFARKTLPEIPALPPFERWAIPKELTGGLCFFLVASLILELAGADFALGVSSTVNVVVGFPLIVQGLAAIDFIIAHRAKKKTLVRVLIYLAVAILFSVLRTALMLIGCMEQLFHYRERMLSAPPRV